MTRYAKMENEICFESFNSECRIKFAYMDNYVCVVKI